MPRPVVAMYKAYRGGEWFQASLDSIKDFVDAIEISFSRKPWIDTDLPGNTFDALKGWAKHRAHPTTWWWSTEATNQSDQYEEAYQRVREHHNDPYVLIVDTDEIWRREDLAQLLQFALQNSQPVYRVRMNTYIKRPTYKVWPPEPCTPTVLVDSKLVRHFAGIRGNRICGGCIVPMASMDHFTYVREDFRDIEFKFRTSAEGDGVPSHEDWFERVWPKIPNVRNFHPSKGYEACWRGITEVKIEDLPPTAQPVARRLLEAGAI